MRGLDFSSWEGMLTTLLGLVVITFVMVAIRLLIMQTVQQRRERENRQINERLRTLIAAYKVLGGSFTGILAVDPTHLRDLLRRQTPEMSTTGGATGISDTTSSSDHSRRSRGSLVRCNTAWHRAADATGGDGRERSCRWENRPHR